MTVDTLDTHAQWRPQRHTARTRASHSARQGRAAARRARTPRSTASPQSPESVLCLWAVCAVPKKRVLCLCRAQGHRDAHAQGYAGDGASRDVYASWGVARSYEARAG